MPFDGKITVFELKQVFHIFSITNGKKKENRKKIEKKASQKHTKDRKRRKELFVVYFDQLLGAPRTQKCFEMN